MSVRGRVAPSRIRSTVLAYLALTKPRVIELLLVTAIPAMLLADRGRIDLGPVVGVVRLGQRRNLFECGHRLNPWGS